MNELERAARDLVIANRVLANEGVVDAFGHVSVRHPLDPGRYLLSCSRSPELVEAADVIEFTLDGRPVGDDHRPLYVERFIHGAIYESRPDIHAVVHAHAEAVLPFGITKTPLRPVLHNAGEMGTQVPVWDISDHFGDGTTLLVTNMLQGRDLAQRLGKERAVLMRGHGFTAAGRALVEVVKISIYLPRNARVLLAALQLGEVKGLSSGEIEVISAVKPDVQYNRRAWEYWATRAGCGHLLAQSPGKPG